MSWKLLGNRALRVLGGTAAVAIFSSAAVAANVIVEEAWVRAMPPGQSVTALYFTATNHSDQTCALTSVTTAEARHTELHRTTEEDGVARMRLQDAIHIHAHEQAKLAPGGDHVMLFDVVERLENGDVIRVDLDFGACGQVAIEAEARNAASGHGASSHSHHHH